MLTPIPVSHAYPLHELAHHAAPHALLVGCAVGPVLDRLDGVVEVETFGDAVEQIHAVSLEPVVTHALVVRVALHHDERVVLATGG